MVSSTYAEALKRGCKICHAITIEGIPYVFTQFDDDYVGSASPPTVPAGYISAVNCLVMDKAGDINVELDRRKGIARGGPLKILLTYEGLERAGVLDDLFGRPTAEAVLTADVTQAATTISAATASDLGASGGAYLGKEYFTFTGSSASQFTGVTRGEVGFKYIHKKDSFTSHRIATNRPRTWRGRFVTVFEMLCDPTGRPIESVYATNRPYAREVWRGFVDEQPSPVRYGMELNCLTLERRLSQSLGFTQTWENVEPVALLRDMSLSFHFEKDGSSVFAEYVHGQSSLGAGTDHKWIVGGEADRSAWWLAYHVYLWMRYGDCEAHSNNGGPWALAPSSPVNTFTTDQTPYLTMDPPFINYSMLPNEGSGVPWLQGQQGNHTCLFSYKEDSTSEFPLQKFFLSQVAGSTYKDYTLPDKGLALIHGDAETEIILFEKSTGSDQIYDAGNQGESIDVTQRALAQSKPLKLWERHQNGNAVSSLTMTIPAGDYGPLAEVLLTLLQSSGGAAHFGDYDTLGLGLGCAIPEDYINVSTFLDEDKILDATAITIADGVSTFDKLLGGWLVLSGSNVVQRRQADSTIKLEAVKHEVGLWVNSPEVVDITADDVLLSGVNALKVVESPNVVNIDGKGVGVEIQLPDLVVRDIPRCQQEGPHTLKITAGGCSIEEGFNGAKKIIAYGDGQFSIKLPLAPWVEVQPGDRCALDFVALGQGHPLLFNYESGEHPNSEKLPARCMGVSRNFVTGAQTGTFLLYGATLPGLLLAPTVTVTNVSGSDITLSEADAKLFDAGDYIELYNPGNEDLGTPELATIEITGKTGDVLTLASVPAWVASTTTHGTFPPFANADATQKEHAYNKEDKFYAWY